MNKRNTSHLFTTLSAYSKEYLVLYFFFPLLSQQSAIFTPALDEIIEYLSHVQTLTTRLSRDDTQNRTVVGFSRTPRHVLIYHIFIFYSYISTQLILRLKMLHGLGVYCGRNMYLMYELEFRVHTCCIVSPVAWMSHGKQVVDYNYLSWSDFYQIQSNLIKTTNSEAQSRGLQTHVIRPENMRRIIGGIMLSTPSSYTSFQNTIQTQGHFISPYPHWDIPQIGERVHGHIACLWDESNNGPLLAMDPHLVRFLFSYVLEVF